MILARTYTPMKESNREYKRSPDSCPHCGERHEVYVAESDDIVAVLPIEGDLDWADEYPLWEGYQYYYKKCPDSDAGEVRVIARERSVA
jgi:hypothetical protein